MPCTSSAVLPLAILPAMLLVVASCRNADVVTASYANLDEAQNAGAVREGWMPAGLPSGAYDIRAAHDASGSRRWGLFSFPPDQASALQRLLETDETSLTGEVCDAPGRIEWWPIVLRGQLDGERIRATGLRGYRSTDGSLLFAVNWKQRRAYYWTPASRGRP